MTEMPSVDGTILPGGTTMPGRTTIPADTTISDGTTIPDGTTSPDGIAFPAGIAFRCMGSEIRLTVERPLAGGAGTPSPREACERERAYIESFAARLSRFRGESELSRLNADRRRRVAASPLLLTAVRAGLWAARRSGGLVDPTLAGAIAEAGYARSREGERPASLADALACAPPRRPARAAARADWRRVSVRNDAIERPRGIALDTGGTGKGLCADAVAHRLSPYTRFAVDCGGDIAIGGLGAQLDPYEVEVEHPLTGESIRTLRVGGGGVATSGLNVALWRTPDGGFAHHLLDPSTGRPAWTGLIGATALGASSLEEETLAKAALLAGPDGACRILAEHGGLIVADDGEVIEVGRLDEPFGALGAGSVR